MQKKLNISQIIAKKGVEKITMITAYDALFANLFDEFIDIILVGDSLNMNFKGEKDTLNASIDEMIYHTKAVKMGAKNTFIVTDMPFGSTIDTQTMLKSAVEIYKKSGCDAVKIEGSKQIAPGIKKLCDEGISVMGHIGLKPQLVRFEGGYKIKGKTAFECDQLVQDALALQDAGVFAIVIEGTLSNVAQKITKALEIPTIGIGSGVNTDGQVLVFSDMLGLDDKFKPKFVKKYLDGANLVKNAIKTYCDEVKSCVFPDENYEYGK